MNGELEELPRIALAPILEREVRERDGEDGEGGRDLLARQLAASGLFTYDNAVRRLYSILSGHAVRRTGEVYVQESVTLDTVDRMLQALDLTDLWYSDPVLIHYAPAARELRCEDCGRQITAETGYRPLELMRPQPGAPAGKRSRPGGRRFRKYNLCRRCAGEALYERATKSNGQVKPGDLPKRGGRPRLLSDDQLRAAHLVYERRRLSMPDIANLLLAQGHKGTKAGLTSAMLLGWRRLGLKVRTRSESNRAAHHLRGRIPRVNPVCSGRKRDDTPCTAKAVIGQELCASHLRFGSGAIVRVRCAGVKQWSPRKGEPCHNYSQPDSEFCKRHDPRYSVERAVRLAELRSRIGRRSREQEDALLAEAA